MFTLEKKPDKDFVILNLTDTQMDDAQFTDLNNPGRIILYNTMKRVIKKVKPDFITLTGDYGYGDSSLYVKIVESLCEFLEQYEVPYSMVWGNHDNQAGPEIIQKTVDALRKYPHFVYDEGDPEMGNGNYVVEIKEGDKTVNGLIFMDSHDRSPYVAPDGTEILDWSKLYPCQLDWYEAKVRELQKKGCNESVMFMHIPIYAYRDAAEAAFPKDTDLRSITPEQSYNPDFWNEGYKDSFGVQYEGVGSYPEDDGAFDRILKLGSTKLVLCGHEHVNNFVINYKGVRLAYALKTGTGCYWHRDLNGGTVMKIDGEGKVKLYHEYIKVED